MSAKEALLLVARRHWIRPNEAFFQCLVDYEAELKAKRSSGMLES
jgi:hypothetical protein